MAQSTGDHVGSIDQLDWVVDADAHIMESVEDLLPYMDDRYEASRRIIESAKRPLADIYSVTHAMPPFAFVETAHGEDEDMDVHMDYSPDEKLAEMGEFGIDFGILDPTLNLGLTTVENRQVAVALANAYNSWILDEYLDENDEFVASILVPPQKPDAAAEEIDRRAAEDDMVGVFIPSTGVVPPLGHEMYDPIYAAAQSHGLPVVQHGGNLATTHVFPTQRRWNESYTENHVIVHPFGHMWNLATMLVRGVPDRFPDLEFVFQEAGIAWVPYFVWRMDDHYMELSHEFHINRLPSEYIAEQFYFTTQPLGHTARNPDHLASIIDIIGSESIMYASDLPHTDFDPPAELFDRIRGYFDPDQIRDMMGETAAAVFDLPV